MAVLKILKVGCILFLISSKFPCFGQPAWPDYFNDCDVKGSITIFDYGRQKWISSDIHDSNTPTLPASTFKIINTLIVLETGTIKSVEDIVVWPGKIDTSKYGYRPEIFKNLTLHEAFKQSAGWAYVELAKKIGKDRYRFYLDKCNYGNLDLSINDDDFWNFGSFAISPINQIEILKGIYEETLPFSKSHFKSLKEIMIVKQTENYVLRAKTGWSRYGGLDTGWWVGYLETKGNTYFFATRIIKDRSDYNPNFSSCRMKITYAVFRDLGIIK